MIKITNICKVFRTEEIETVALDNVSFEIKDGEFVSIMGPSGCGKSTLLNILGLLDNPTSGSYQLLGQEVAQLKEKDRTKFRKGNIGFVFQSFNLIDELNVFENIELPLRYMDFSAAERKEKVEAVMARMNISHRAKHFPQQLSGGQQQRVAIARAVVANPKLILADEPTGNLDSKNGKEVMDLLCELNREGTTIVMVTHSQKDAAMAQRTIAVKENITIDDESLHIIARKADGAMRDALTIFDQTVAFCGTDVKYEDVLHNLNVLDFEHGFKITEQMLANDYASALLEFDSILSKGFNALYFVSSLSDHFRNLVVAKNAALDALLELPDSLKKKYKEQADKCSLQFLYNALAITAQCEAGYKESINPRLHIEFTLMKLCFLSGGEVALNAVQSVPAAPRQAAPARQAAPVEKAVAASGPVVDTPESRTASQASAETPAPQKETTPSTAESPVQTATEPTPVQVNDAGQTETQANAEEQPAPAPAAKRRRATKTASSLSLDAINEEGERKEVSASGITLSDKMPEDLAIYESWKKIPEQYVSRPRLYTTLSSTKTTVTNKESYKLLEFYVQNSSQKAWVEQELLRELESKIQKDLGSSRVRLAVEVIPQEKVEKRIYMPEDKAKAMISGNEEIGNLVKDFGLDVK